MTFLQPWWFLLLALGAVIIALHVRRRRQLPVSSLLIWRQVQPEEARRPVSGLPPLSLPLVLQLLALALVTLALARPQLGGSGGPDHWIVLIDTSAAVREHGMAADLPQLLQQHPEARLTLVEAGGQPLVRATRVTERHAVSAEAPVWTDEDSDWLAALRLVSGLAPAQEETLVTVIAPPRAAREASLMLPALLPGARAEFLTSGPDAPNNRFLRVDLNGDNAGWQLSGFVASDTTVRMLFRPQGTETALPWADIATVSGRFSADLDLPGPGSLELQLPADSLSADNIHRLEIRPGPAPLSVLLTGDGSEALERAFIATGQAEIALADDASPNPGLRVFTASEAADSSGPSLSFLPGDDSVTGPVTATGTPLTAGLDFRGLVLSAARVLEPAATDEVLLETASGPLGILRHTGSGPQVILGFGPEDSNWAELPSFPAFIANLVDYLQPAGSCVVGQPCRVGNSAAVADPDGQPLIPDAAGAILPRVAGIYLLDNQPLPVNVIGPVRQLSGAGGSLPAPETAADAPAAWRILVVLAAIVLLTDALLALRDKRRRPLGLALQAGAAALLLLSLVGVPLRIPVTVSTRALLAEPGVENAGLPLMVIGGEAGEPGVAAGALADGLRLARGLLPAGGELVVAGSGSLQRGDLQPAIAQLQADRITVHALSVPAAPESEALVTGMTAPRNPHAGEPYTLTATVYSTVAGPADVRLLRAGTEVESRSADLEAGLNRLEFTATDAAGTWLYEAEVTAAADTETANNRHGRFVSVVQRPRVAVVTRQTALGELFVHALNVQGLDARLLPPISLPWNEESFRAFDSIVMLDLPALELHSTQQRALEEWVSQRGGGLLILGGANSYGPGGYYQTPLEDVSPLSSLVDRESPEVALLFVLDRSGSMQQEVGDTNRLEIAKEATLGAIRVLGTESQVGIIMFDTVSNVLVPLQSTADLAPFAAALEPLAPSGGTAIHPALVHALEQMQGVEATAKHIIVMTDGLSQPADFAPVLRDLRAMNVTISTVAIGQGADVTGLANIARLGAGATHATTDFRALPSILGQEAMLLAGNSVEEQPITPEWLADPLGPEFSALASLPGLGGFTRTSLKDDAVLHLRAVDAEGEDVPLLATWKYGLGNVAAFASQGAGPWAIEWMKLQEFPALWAQLVRWTLPAVARPGLTVSTELQGDELLVSLTALTEDGRPRSDLDLEAVALTPEGDTADVSLLRPVGEGLYQTRLLLTESGVSWLGISPRAGSGPSQIEPLETPVLVSYPAALNYAAADSGRLERLTAATGGTVMLERNLSPARELRWITAADPAPWMLAGIMAFLLGLWLRYGVRRRVGQTRR